MKTFLFENWKTSLLGMILVGAGIYTGFTAKQSWTESATVILSGIVLICSKDARRTPENILSDNIKNRQPHDELS